MVTLWGRASSSNVQCVRWALEELGVPYTRIDAGEGFGGLDTPEFLAMNPMGKIPVLQDADLALFESAAILRHLARTRGEHGGWPADPVRRAQVDMWAEWAKQEVANRFTGPVFWRVVRTPAPRRDMAAIREAVVVLEQALTVADARLQRQDWLAGDQISPGDFHLGHILYRYFDISITRADLPALRAYYDRLTERPAYQSCVMLNYDALRDTI